MFASLIANLLHRSSQRNTKNYTFNFIDLDSYGRQGDGEISSQCTLFYHLQNKAFSDLQAK